MQKQQLEALAQAQKEAKQKNTDTSRTESRSDVVTPTPSLTETAETPSTSSTSSKRTGPSKRDRSSDSVDVRPESADSALSVSADPHITSPISPKLNLTRSPTPNSIASGSRLIFAPQPPVISSVTEGKTSATPPPSKRPKLSCHPSHSDTNGYVGDSAHADPQSPSASATSMASPPASNQKRKIRPNNKVDPSQPGSHRATSTNGGSCGTPKSRLKNIDKNSARSLAVTVDGLTVVITDYKVKPPRVRPPKPPAPLVMDDCNKEESTVEEISKLNEQRQNGVKLENISDEPTKEETNVVQMLAECQQSKLPRRNSAIEIDKLDEIKSS